MIDSIAKITADFLESYDRLGGINHLSGPNLPSKLGVLAIIDDLESLIFPGFKTEEAIEHGSLSFMVAEKLNRLVNNLSTEVTRSLSYERRIGVNVAEKNAAMARVNGTNGTSANGAKTSSKHQIAAIADASRKTGVSILQTDDTSQHFVCRKDAEDLAAQLAASIPSIRDAIYKDVEAAFAGDPAAKSREEVILSYPAVEAITIHRVAHKLWSLGVPLIPRMMSEVAHTRTGIDIHPGATIGEYFFIDHGTGVVIGETTVIGSRVKLYQGVTLGAASVKKEEANAKRHPTLEDEVTVYANATILGGKTVIGKGSVIGGNVFIIKSVSPGSRVYNKEADYVVRNPNDYMLDFQI